jgi:hypothetical protein
MIKKTLPSGAELDITLLEYEDAWAIARMIMDQLEKLKIDLSGLDLENMTLDDIKATDVMKFKSPICALLASSVVVEAARICFVKCTYNGLRISKQTFNSVEARGDYLFAAFHSIKENVSPFFASLLSFLQTN